MSATNPAAENEALVRTVIEELGDTRNLDVLDETHARDFVLHSPLAPDGTVTGREAYKQTLQGVFEAFPDLTLTIEDLVAAGDTVAYRLGYAATHEGEFMGIPPTGTAVTWDGMAFLRVADGRITEVRGQADTLGLLQQLGVTAVPTE